MSQLVVHGGGPPLRGRVTAPGDKSISHRALILGALANGASRIRGLSVCADVERTRACLRCLGVTLAADRPGDPPRYVEVAGVGPSGLGGANVWLDCGDSGTTMRLLAGVLVGQDRRFVLDGGPSLRRRPMRRLVDPLRLMGARIAGSHGRPPLVGRGGPLWGAVLDLAAASAQAGSAVLLGALNASGRTVVRYPAPVRDHTERMLAAMGAPIEWSALESVLAGPCARLQPPAADGWKVPGDLSSAAFLAAAAAIVRGSEVQIDGVGLNPGRTGLLEILAHMGARLEVSAESLSVGEPVGRLLVGAAPICGVEVAGHLVPRAIDELPLVAVLGAVAQGVTHVRDAVELRVKESDRIAAMVAGLRAMGAHAEEAPDGYRVWGPSELHGARVSGRQDHRVVMALAVAALAAEGETRIQDAERIADSFPGFVETMTALGADMRLVQ